MRYAKALQAGNCDEVVGLTAWMRQRLRNAESAGSGDTSTQTVRRELCDAIQDRAVEGNRLEPEGVEDRYVFAPGTELETLPADAGRSNLSKPVRERVWIRVTFPAPERALCDADGRPIRRVSVGVNVSLDGYVVKANVIGNLDVDRESIEYYGEADQGG